MRLALECPKYLLKDIQPLADFDWILTHLVLEDREYANYYARGGRRKVLDNSTNELLEPCSLGDMKKAAEIVSPNLIVPPDFLGDHFATMEALDEAIEVFGKGKLLPCVQGCKFRDVYECAEYIRKLGFRRVAVPYDITSVRTDKLEDMADRRYEVVSRLSLVYGFEEIHLLGMTTLGELEDYGGIGIKSIDTGVPILMGLNGKILGVDNLEDKKSPTLSLMPNNPWSGKTSLEASMLLRGIYYNIAFLRRIISE